MATYEFGVEDLLRLRFAISPMWEVVASLRRLREPSGAGLHLPWIHDLRDGRRAGIDLAPALSLTPPTGYVPDFVSPPPTTPLAPLEDEIDLLRQTPPRRGRHDLGLLPAGRRAPPALEPFLKTPRRAMRRLGDEL